VSSTPSLFATQLAVYATETGGPLPLLDGSSGLLKLNGMAYVARPSSRPSAGRWFRQTPTCKALLRDPDYPVDQRNHILVVNWRWLLAHGLLQHKTTANTSAPLRQLAHRAWWLLLPLLRDHDAVMTHLLTRACEAYQQNPARVAEEPFWVGFNGEAGESRFDAHATALLADRRTDKQPHEGFCEKASRWLATMFQPAVHRQTQRSVGLCIVGQHVRGGFCPTCPEVAVERPFLLALEVPALKDQRLRRTFGTLNAAPAKEVPSVRRDNLRWILDARSRLDGIYRFTHFNGTPSRFIDIQRLWQRWVDLELPTMFDKFPPPDQIEGPRQAYAFLVRLLEGAVISPHDYSAAELFVEAGWGSSEDYATSYSQFIAVTNSALLALLQREDRRAAAVVRARLSLQNALAKTTVSRRVVRRTWVPPNEDLSITIQVVRAKSRNKVVRNFYTLPYVITDPMVTDRRARVGKGILYEGQLYWTPQAINSFANQTLANGEPTYPWAREFCEWVNLQDETLDSAKAFRAAVYSERLPERLRAIARGEQAHLGAYSQQEDETIREFFSACGKQRLLSQDWLPLLEAMPGRNERGIRRRFEEMGKKYAFQHGYQAYTQSVYYRSFSAKRRKQWMKEGCPA